MKPKGLLTIARILLLTKSKSVSNEFNIDHRFCTEGHKIIDFQKTLTHVSKSLTLLRKIDVEVFDEFKKYFSKIYYILDNKHSFEIFSREGILIISIPYYFELEFERDDYDYEWYEGITACLFVRASSLMKRLIIYDDGGKISKKQKEYVVSKAKLNEREFVKKLGDSWVELYEGDNYKKLPEIIIN